MTTTTTNNAPSFKFTARSSSVVGVTEYIVDARNVESNFIQNTWDAPIIAVRGQVFITERIHTSLTGGPAPWLRSSGVKYGPGARRQYVRVDEKLIEEMAGFNQPGAGRSARENRRRDEVQAFCLALIDLLIDL